MKKKRRYFTREFKIETVRLITEEGLSVSKVARDHGIDGNLIRKWVKQYSEETEQKFPGTGPSQSQEALHFRPDYKGRITGFLKQIFNSTFVVLLSVLAVLISYALFAYYKTSGNPDVNYILFGRVISFIFCAPLLAMPVWFAYEYVFSSSKGEPGVISPPLYAAVFFLFIVAPVFLPILWGLVSFPFLQGLVAPFLCPVGYEGPEIGFFYMPAKTEALFCRGEFGQTDFEHVSSPFVLFAVFAVAFAIINICLLTASLLMKGLKIKSGITAVVLTAVIYISLLGAFVYNHKGIRPYVRHINFYLNKTHYGNFLYFKASEGNIEKIKRVLDAGVDPNLRHYMGGVPLAFAAQLGRANVVKLLLDYGADPALIDEKGKTALDYALERAQKGSSEFALLAGRMQSRKARK
jgi:hypothetical protein